MIVSIWVNSGLQPIHSMIIKLLGRGACFSIATAVRERTIHLRIIHPQRIICPRTPIAPRGWKAHHAHPTLKLHNAFYVVCICLSFERVVGTRRQRSHPSSHRLFLLAVRNETTKRKTREAAAGARQIECGCP